MSHDLISEVLKEGDNAIDATVGNGLDTCFLAQLVGRRGRVYGFDIQEDAIKTSLDRTIRDGFSERVELFHICHSAIAETIPSKVRVQAILYNLGYFPGGDTSITTRGSKVVASIEASLPLLKSGGRVVVVSYSEHNGAAAERNEINLYFSSLSPHRFKTFEISQPNLPRSPEILMLHKTHKGNADQSLASS